MEGGRVHRVFGSEGGFGDQELRTIQSTRKWSTPREPALPEPDEAPAQSLPLPRVQQDKAA
jgi:hypothetical protein